MGMFNMLPIWYYKEQMCHNFFVMFKLYRVIRVQYQSLHFILIKFNEIGIGTPFINRKNTTSRYL